VWALIGDAFDVFVGATPSRAKPEYWDGGIPWVSSGEVAFCRIKQTRETISADGLESTSTYLHPAGTVLLGMIGEGKTRGQVAILDIEACNNQNSAAIRVSETKVLPEYIYSFLEKEYEDTRRRGSGGNQPALNKERVRQIPFPLPPVDEQKRIMDEINLRLSVVHETEAQVNANIKRAEGLRQSILSRAFTETSMACLRVSAVAA
jgi:type I restriction enzyme S subunit